MTSNNMGTPTPEKSGAPPTGKVGEGEDERIKTFVEWTISDIRKEIIKLLFGDDAVAIEPSERYEWNAYVYRDWGGSREFRDFRTGGYYDYLAFKIRVLKELIKELNEELEDAERRIEELDEKWEAVIGKH